MIDSSDKIGMDKENGGQKFGEDWNSLPKF